MFRFHVIGGVVLILLGLCVTLSLRASAQDLPDRSRQPAWPDVFISLGMYHVTYEKPLVGKGDQSTRYQQKASYTWTGGRYEIIHVTLARDPAFKDKYSADALKKEKNPPKELNINKKRAWHWKLVRESPKLGDVTNRLVVLLGHDKAIIIEQIGFGANLEETAKRFDFAKVEKALANPPVK